MELTVDYSKRNLVRSGVYVGGIGSGGFELRPDGKFYRCRIFNDWRAKGILPEPSIDACFLYQYKNQTYLLQLDDLVNPVAIIQGVKKIKYRGEFPILKLSYPGLPVEIEFLSFFIPGDVKNSSLPSVLCRVKGRGNLYFLFPSLLPCKTEIKDRKVLLKTEKGELRIYSGAGTPFYAQQGPGVLRHIFLNGKIPKADRGSESAGEYYAGMSFEKKFDSDIIISWFFPDMRDYKDNFIGHNYANHFQSCEEVENYVVKNKSILKDKTEKFHKKVYNSNLPAYLKDSYTAQLSSFVKQSWLAKDGRFGVWEGSCSCCGLQTTDVSYYGSWLYVKLFPELEKSGMRLTAKFQKADGWIPHFFPGTFGNIDEYRRKDMNMQFVLMAYRDYVLWKDEAFIKEMYPAIKKAVSGVYAWDTDGDRIPDIEGPDQTFDVWGWKGCSIYLASLWLASLKAGIELGKMAGDSEFVKQCSSDFETVRKNIINKLWNGKYFILWADGINRDDGCLLDALSGDWYCYLTGLGHILPEDMIKSHLRECLKYNRKRIDPSYMKMYYTPGEEGWCYINGGYKNDKRVSFQQYEPWTGLEYAFAVHLYIMGMKKETLRVISDVYNRKLKCGMVWNHIECGGDYFRPMVIGIFYDMFRSTLRPWSFT